MRKYSGGAAATVALLALSLPAHAVLIDPNGTGLTYTLTETTIDANTHSFVLGVTGINTASDTEGGRTGLNSVAFQLPTGFVSATMTSPAGFNLVPGGLNSSGCNEDGAFFCFDDPLVTGGEPVPGALLGSSFNIAFTVDTSGIFDPNYDPSMKIDWVGTKNNYDLVSMPVGITNPPPDDEPPDDDPPTPVPEPGSLALLGSMLAGAGLLIRRRTRKDG